MSTPTSLSEATAWLGGSGFVVLFAVFWVVITAVLGAMSGWFALQRRYPASAETPLRTLYMQSGALGAVTFSGCLTLAACPSGLRVKVWRVFGPFQRPFEVPWREVIVEPRRRLFGPGVGLRFGAHAMGPLELSARAWERLVEAAPLAGGSVGFIGRN